MADPKQRYLRVVDPAPEAAALPRVWLLLGERQGDNAQVLALGRALTREVGWPHEVKQISYDQECEIPFRDRGASLIGVDLERTDRLSAPWPDVVIAIGRRAAPVSRWLKEQTNGRLLNIHLGRPRIAYQHFDLIFTTPQYSLPSARNVTKLTLPIILHDEALLEAEAKRWLPHLEGLPRPWTAVFVGGPTSQLAFDRHAAVDLLARARVHARRGGTLLVTTSPRTPPEVAELLSAEIRPPHFMHRWAPKEPNPYQALLKLADDFIVTNDSVSMIAEAVDMMKPVYVFEAPRRPKRDDLGTLQTLRHYFRTRREEHLIAGAKPDLTDRFYDALTRIGRARPRRSVAVFDRKLYQTGLARPLGRVEESSAHRAWIQRRIPKEERDMAVARIRAAYEAKRAKRAE
jgi:mitochondrial fission protein ELM1